MVALKVAQHPPYRNLNFEIVAYSAIMFLLFLDRWSGACFLTTSEVWGLIFETS